ncbi:hypothetical protein MCETE7_00164 [Acidimicrobiia bacterium]
MLRYLVIAVIFGVIFALYNLLRGRIDPKFKGAVLDPIYWST